MKYGRPEICVTRDAFIAIKGTEKCLWLPCEAGSDTDYHFAPGAYEAEE